MRIYALIPARKGSKRLPQKNIRSLNGKLLIEYAILEAKKSKYITETFISTDDPVVIRTANKYGLKHLKRDPKLCTDTASMQEVIDDFLDWIPWDKQPDILVLLQPTSPLRIAEDIDKCISMFLNGYVDSVITVKEIAPHTYYPNGAVYVFKRNIYQDNIGFILMPRNRSIDIDTIEDFEMCRIILNEKNGKSI